MPDTHINDTAVFSVSRESKSIRDILLTVYGSMQEKGYDPINQLAGYLLSGDPTYVTSYRNSRYLISRIERYELIEELVKYYIETQKED